MRAFCHNMIPQAGGLTLQKLLSHSSGGCRSESKVPARSGSESSLPGWQVATFSLCLYAAFPQGVHEDRQMEQALGCLL